MGFIRVPIRLRSPANGREPVQVEALVDTGAIYSIVPRDTLESLSVEPTGRTRFRTIEGRPIERDVGVVQIEVQERPGGVPVPVIFGEAAAYAVLGVTALGIMGLEVDPTRGELRPTEFLLL